MPAIKRILPADGWKAVLASRDIGGREPDSEGCLPLLYWAEMENGDVAGLVRNGEDMARADEIPDFLGYTL